MVVAVLALALVALGQTSISAAAPPQLPDEAAALHASLNYEVWFPLIAACFIGLGGCAFVLASERVAARIFLGFNTAAATALLAAIAMPSGASWALEAEYVALAGLGASAPLLFLVFPVNRLSSPASRRLLAFCITGHAALVGLSCAALVLHSLPLFSALVSVLLSVLAADLAGAIALALGVLFLPPPLAGRERRLLGLVALGTAAGLAPFPLFVVGPALASDNYLMAPWIAISGLVLLPASLATAILSRQFLGIEHIVRRGLIGLLVWMALLCAYGVTVDQFGDRVGAWSEDPPPGWLLIVVAGIAGTFPLVQSWLRRALEHLLFRDVYDYRQTLQQLGFEIVHLRTADEIAEHVLIRLGRTLDLSWAAISLTGDAGKDPPYCWGQYPSSVDDLRRSAIYTCALVADGVPIGELSVGAKRHDIDLRPEDLSLLATLAHLLSTALKNALLLEQLEAQVCELAEREWALHALSARLMRVQEEERRRLALDIHDDALQRAVLLARRLRSGVRTPDVEAYARQAEDIADSLRALCSGLRPAELDDLGLVAGLETLAQTISAESHVTAILRVEPADEAMETRLDADLECALYRVAQEALNNCLKHADASRVEIVLTNVGHSVTLSLADDGRGLTNTRHGRTGLGILGMRERLRAWGGSVTIAPRPGGGTVVLASVSTDGVRKDPQPPAADDGQVSLGPAHAVWSDNTAAARPRVSPNRLPGLSTHRS